MTGHLELVCGVDAGGRSVLRRQSFRAPMHISKPHEDEGTLVVNVVNPTAGLFSGDAVRWNIAVDPGARLLLTSPSATRAHRMESGEAFLEQTFAVAAGGFLEVLPEIFIPQLGARYRQNTRIDVENGGELIFFETLAPGRVASGEVFEYAALDWTTDVYFGGVKIVRERYALQGGAGSLAALRTAFPQSYFASVFFIGEKFGAQFEKSAGALHGADAWVGCSRLARGGCVVKVLAEGSIALRRTMGELRRIAYVEVRRNPPGLRRV